MAKFIATSCEFRLTEDDWKEGEGKTVSFWNEDVEPSDSIEGLLKNVPCLDCDYDQNRKLVNNCLKVIFDGIFENDPVHEGDFSRFDGDLMVDVNSFGAVIKPSKERWQRFTNGECKLYNLHIIIYVKKICDLSKDDVISL